MTFSVVYQTAYIGETLAHIWLTAGVTIIDGKRLFCEWDRIFQNDREVTMITKNTVQSGSRNDCCGQDPLQL